MREHSEKTAESGYEKEKVPFTEKKHYACALCHEEYEFTDAQHKKITCCGRPVDKTEETIMSSPEPFGP